MKGKESIVLVFLFLIWGCKEKTTTHSSSSKLRYAKGFTIKTYDNYKVLEVKTPWANAEEKFTYLLIEKGKKPPLHVHSDVIIKVPIEKIVVTSTTHIPALEALGVENTLVGFPNTAYVSSEKIRKNIAMGRVKDLGNNETITTEALIELQPEVLIGFSIDHQNKAYETIQRFGIPVVYNGDWAEETPLGKAEWIKFFALFFNAGAKADSIFNAIEQDYLKAKKIAEKAGKKPTVLSGAMYKNVWYLPAGKSWTAQILNDANAEYLWKNTEGDGSLSLSFEEVLENAENADAWIAPAQFTSYKDLENASLHYTQFNAFKNKRIYTFSLSKGETGGLLYYELAPNRPDIVLKDVISILHPELLPGYTPFFFKPLQ
jgi:iron complex transport system substrate-binding protein